MRKTIAILFIIFSGFVNAQIGEKIKDKIKDVNPRNKYPSAVQVYAFGPVGLGALTYDYFIQPNFAIEGGIGYHLTAENVGFTFGGRFHPLGRGPQRATPYVGLYNSVGPVEDSWEYYNLYIPVGINRIQRNGFNWSFEIAFQWNTSVGRWISGGIKFGPRFKIFS
ncbi:MAG: hypothetical protein MK078_01830 [Crocinitomicaceae bacterium]|nr:hypothetical protein [Crocinitomicaceae bacterium]